MVEAKLNLAVIKQAKVISNDTDGLFSVELLKRPGAMNAITVRRFYNSNAPAIGQVGVILYLPNDPQEAYWLGSLFDVEKLQIKDTAPQNPNIALMESADGNSSLSNSKDNFAVVNKNLEIASDTNNFSINHDNGTLALMRGKFVVENKTAKIDFGKDNSVIQTTSALLISSLLNIDVMTKSSFILSSGIYDPKETDALERLGPINNFIVKTTNAKLSVGQMTVVDSGALTVNLASRKLMGGGLLNNTTLKLNVIQGDTVFTSGLGNIDITTLGIPNFISLSAGTLLTGIFSRVKLTRLAGELRSFTAGLSSYMEVSKGIATIDSTLKVNISAGLDIKMSSKATATLSALATLNLKSNGIMNIEANAMIKVKSTMLNTKDAKIFDIGTGKKVAPNPANTGGWCAVPVCPFTGSIHVGNMLM